MELSIICAYRNREDRLHDFIRHYETLYPDAEILIMNQCDSEKFKKGGLYNLGFLKSQGKYLAFIDIDIRLKYFIDFVGLLNKHNTPLIPYNFITHIRIHTVNSYTDVNKKMWENNPGGIHLFKREDYEKINGYSNLYWGYAYEDNEMLDRIQFYRVKNTISHIEHNYERGFRLDMDRNRAIYDSRNNRDIMLDGYRQVDCGEISKNKLSKNCFLYNVKKISVCKDFVYNKVLNSPYPPIRNIEFKHGIIPEIPFVPEDINECEKGNNDNLPICDTCPEPIFVDIPVINDVVMPLIKADMTYDMPIEYSFKKKVAVHLGRFNVQEINKNMLNILVVLEPYSIRDVMRWMPNSQIIEHSHLFNYIITFDEELLSKCKNAIFWIYGHCSFEGEYAIPVKKFGISALNGNKAATIGHKLRHSIYAIQDKILIPRDFYISSRFKLNHNSFQNLEIGNKPNDKLNLFKTQFHLCIENSIEKNYFTEKIIDCMMAKTMPVYYGCSDIFKYFNKDGIIIINGNVDDIIDKINSLTPRLYEESLSAIEDNYKRALEYIDFPLRLRNLISNLIDNE